jgi:hypothetical protein
LTFSAIAGIALSAIVVAMTAATKSAKIMRLSALLTTVSCCCPIVFLLFESRILLLTVFLAVEELLAAEAGRGIGALLKDDLLANGVRSPPEGRTPFSKRWRSVGHRYHRDYRR